MGRLYLYSKDIKINDFYRILKQEVSELCSNAEFFTLSFVMPIVL